MLPLRIVHCLFKHFTLGPVELPTGLISVVPNLGGLGLLSRVALLTQLYDPHRDLPVYKLFGFWAWCEWAVHWCVPYGVLQK
jgi:hypothetical protein